MLWVKLGTHVIDHERFLAAGAIARDLYEWGMLYAGKHESDGLLPMVAVLASAWGAGMKANIKPALKLVDVGLWERTDNGFRICRWAEQGNQTKAQIDADRAAARERIARRRSENVRANSERTTVDVPTSTSSGYLISSGSDLASEVGALTPALRVMVAQVCEPAGVELDAEHEWLTYVAHCGREGRNVTAAGWKYWLCNAAKFAKRDRVRESSRGSKLVQSAENRAWIVPKDMP